MDTFVWGKKLQKEGLTDIDKREIEKMQKQKMIENKLELEKVKKRRIEREKEREERENERVRVIGCFLKRSLCMRLILISYRK